MNFTHTIAGFPIITYEIWWAIILRSIYQQYTWIQVNSERKKKTENIWEKNENKRCKWSLDTDYDLNLLIGSENNCGHILLLTLVWLIQKELDL